MLPPYQIPSAALIAKIRRYIAEHLHDAADMVAEEPREIPRRTPQPFEGEQERRDLHAEHLPPPLTCGRCVAVFGILPPGMGEHMGSLFSRLRSKLNKADETFSERLLRLIDESGMTDVEAYKRARIDRKLFSKIRTDKNYHPKIRVVYAFIFVLHLNLDDARDLLASAGYSISPAHEYDLAMQYCIEEGFDIDTVNEILYALGMDVL